MTKQAKIFKVKMGKYEFMQKLSQGKDPLSGKKLFTPSEELECALDTLALFVLRYDKLDADTFKVTVSKDTRNQQAKHIVEQKREKQIKNKNVGSRWTSEEDDRLVAEYNSSVPIDQMVAMHDRTRSAIERRILKLIPLSQIRK